MNGAPPVPRPSRIGHAQTRFLNAVMSRSHGRRVGAIVDADTFDRLLAVGEELEDIAAYGVVKIEGGGAGFGFHGEMLDS